MKWTWHDNGKQYILAPDTSSDGIDDLDVLIKAATKTFYVVLTGKSDPSGKVRYSIKVMLEPPNSAAAQRIYDFPFQRVHYRFFVYQEGDIAEREQLDNVMDLI